MGDVGPARLCDKNPAMVKPPLQDINGPARSPAGAVFFFHKRAPCRLMDQALTIVLIRRDNTSRSKGLVIISMPGSRKPSAMATLSA